MKFLLSENCTVVTEDNVFVLKRFALKYLGVNTKNRVCKFLSSGSENKVLNTAVCIHIDTNLQTHRHISRME